MPKARVTVTLVSLMSALLVAAGFYLSLKFDGLWWAPSLSLTLVSWLRGGGGRLWPAIMYLAAAIGGTLAAYEGVAAHWGFWVYIAACVSQSLCWLLPGLFIAVFRSSRLLGLAVFPFAWVGTEWLVGSVWWLGPFANPTLSIGYSQFTTPLMIFAQFGGVEMVSFFVVALGAALAAAFVRPARIWAPSLLVFCGLAANLASDGTPEEGVGGQQIAVVQMGSAENPEEQAAAWMNLEAMLEQKLHSFAGVTILPEVALPTVIAPGSNPMTFADSQGTMFIGLRERSRSSLYNAVFAVQNGVLQRDTPYRKRQLVPLAEAMFSPGSSPSVFEQGGLRIGFLICWENVFREFSLDYAWRGANLLAFVSDDSWAQGSRTAVLHSRISAFRSLETGIPSAFVAKGGFSTVYDGLGRVLVSAPDINNRVLEISAPPVRPQTPFVLFGHRFGELCAITLFAALTLKVFFARKPNPRRLGSSDLEREIFGTRQR